LIDHEELALGKETVKNRFTVSWEQTEFLSFTNYVSLCIS